MYFLDHIWLIPLFPALGAACMFFFGRKLQKSAVNGICVGLVALAFLWTCAAVWQYTGYSAASPGKPFEKVMFTWLGTGDSSLSYVTNGGHTAQFRADAGFLLDPLSSIWLLFVTGVGMLIHIYSTGYMAHEGGYYRFFGYLNLFMFSMLTLILANNYALMFVGWEGVGLCSYLLIGFYFQRHSASTAANKAFIVNRIGDAGFILGMFTIAWYFGSMQYTKVNLLARSGQFHIGDPVITAACLLLFVGACGKSAQFPLYVWLPDAMEGPTPVSALIHAATMVTAGVYMVARSNALFVLAPNAMKTVAIIGAFTAIFAATIALVQNDIKRVLAYSTVSQLGYMFLALGVGSYWVAVFHLFTHAFFKALLFLGSGSVIHALGGEQDMRHMGGLKSKIPITHWTMWVGSVAIAGIPGFAGFFSKDEILWQTYSSASGSKMLWIVGLVTAGLTAFYMWRLMNMTFYGKSRVAPEAAAHIHESPPAMTIPLILLAVGGVFAGWLGVPRAWNLSERFYAFESWLEPSFASAATEAAKGGAHDASTEWILMGISVAVAIIGIVVARYFYHYRPATPGSLPKSLKPLHGLLYHKYYVDEIYDFVFVNGLSKGGGEGLGAFDPNVVDGAVNGAGWLTRFASRVSMWWDTWIVDGAVRFGSFFVKLLSYPVCILQTGRVQAYALFIVVGVLVFFGYYLAGK